MLDYGDAPKAAKRTKEPGAASGRRSFLADALRAANQRRKFVIALALIGAAIGFVATKLMTPRYIATAQIYIDPRTLPGFEKEQASSIQDSTGFINFVETQARILTSQVVLERAVITERLTSDPEFGAGTSLLSKLLGKFGAPVTEDDAKVGAVRALGQKIAIHRAERTFIIDISATSDNPQKSARIANAVAQAYIDTRSSMQTDNAKAATISFSARLGSLRERLIAAEGAVEDYKAKNGFIGQRDQYIDDQALRDLNQQLTYAKTRLEEAQARFQQAQRAKKSSEDLGALASTLNLGQLTAARAAYADASQKLADLASELGPQHPLIRSATARVAEARRLLDAEIERVNQSFKKDYERARDFEAGLRRKVEESRGRAVDSAQASVKLRELEREVDVSRSIYESFLARSRQTAESQQLDPANTHIVTVAVPPIFRSFPPSAALMAGAGLIVGAAIGAALAMWLDRGSAGRGAAAPAAGASFQVTDATRLVLRAGTERRRGDLELTRIGVPVAGPYGDRRELKAIVNALIERLSGGREPSVIAVIGGEANSARTLMAVNLALALTWDGRKVALLDADEKAAPLTSFIEDESVASRRAPGLFTRTSEGILLALPALSGGASVDAVLDDLADGEEGDFDVILCDGADADQKRIDAVLLIAGASDERQATIPAALAAKIIMSLRLDHSDPWRKSPELRKSA